MDKIIWYLLKFYSRKRRERFSVDIVKNQLKTNISKDKKNKFHLVSFSSKYDFPEQYLSIQSFVSHLGMPEKWVVCSDGTHTKLEIDCLTNQFPFVEFKIIDFTNVAELVSMIPESLSDLTTELIDYAQKKPLGKKLFYYLTYKNQQATIFLDSDILFYKKSEELTHAMYENNNGYFMFDCSGNFDSRYRTDENLNINSGFIVKNIAFKNYSRAIAFLKAAEGHYEYFTEQTFFHILMKDNDYVALDTELFVIDTADQFSFKYAIKPNHVALRHYTSPVRFKMWQKDIRWHLNSESNG